jgi:hypothetical protein
VDAVGESPCTVRPGRGLPAYTLWDEARKALRSTAFLQDAQRVEYTVRTYRVYIVPRFARRRRQFDPPRRVTGRPFFTLTPAELATEGYTRVEGDSVAFYGPDAQVLLSDEFMDTHCLYVDERHADRQTVALGFEPVHRQGIVDIRGYLRFNRRTGELRSVEYQYLEADGTNRQSPTGGSVDFQRLENGAWAVTHWRIHTTNIDRWIDWRAGGRETQTLTDIRQSGGDVTDIRMLPAPVPATP